VGAGLKATIARPAIATVRVRVSRIMVRVRDRLLGSSSVG